MTVAEFIEQLKHLPQDAQIGGIELNQVDLDGEIDWDFHREIGAVCISELETAHK